MPLLHNLPPQLTSFVGRERELAEVRRLLGTSRLLTLAGPGGSGKTRLALQVASELICEPGPQLAGHPPESSYSGGVYFVNLAPISDPDLVVTTIAQTLDVKEVPRQPLTEMLKSYLRGKELLLLLDNFEQVWHAAPVVVDLLKAAPDIKMLVTSREPLRLQGEQQFLVPPLALPPTGEYDAGPLQALQPPSPVEYLPQYEAVALFIERAKAVRADFELTEENATAVAEICHRLDGLPLAIELAAARLRHLSPATMLERLGHRLQLLTRGAKDLPPRQQTLRSTIGWSYDLLSEGEKQLFRRMAVFQGGRTLEALDAVCNYDGLLQVDVLEGVSALVDKNLLQQREGSEGELRFVILETIHEYAREKLQESGEEQAIRREHARFFMRLAEIAEQEFKGPRAAEWSSRIDTEFDNIRAALKWSVDSGEIETAGRISGAVGSFWWGHGHISEGRQWFDAVLTTVDRGSGRKRALPLALRGKALCMEAVLIAAQGDYELATSTVEQGLKLYRGLGDKQGVAMALLCLAYATEYAGDYQRAMSISEEALKLFQEMNDVWGVAGILNNQARITVSQGDYETARLKFEECLSLCRKIGYTYGMDRVLTSLGNLALHAQQYEEAESLFQQSLSHAKEPKLRQQQTLAQNMEGLAGVAAGLRQPTRAGYLFGAANALREAKVMPVLISDRALYERSMAAARSQLDDVAWHRAWATGRSMSLEQAIAYALQEVPEAEPTTRVRTSPKVSYPNELTRREVEVLRLVAEGFRNNEVAERLFLSPVTVNRHLTSVYSKLNVKSRTAAAHFASEHRLL